MAKATTKPGVISYKGVIKQSDKAKNNWAWVDFSYDLKELYGISNLVPAVIRFDGIEYRGSISKMGGAFPMLLIKRDILKRLNKKPGDSVNVRVALDDAPRVVELPNELKDYLTRNIQAKEIYDNLALIATAKNILAG